jgi:hypothetical protein
MDKHSFDYPLALEVNKLAVQRIEQIERDVQIWADRPIEFSFDPSGTGLFSMEELARSFAKRAADFSKSIRSLLANDHAIPATVVGRALIETIGMGCLFLHDMNRLVSARDRERFDERLSRFYAGTMGQPLKPVHVMDAIRHLEKIDGAYIHYLDSKHDMFSVAAKLMKDRGHELSRTEFSESLSAIKNYDMLSEVSHPNGTGTQFMYGQSGPSDAHAEHLRHRLRQASLMSIWQCHHLLVALESNADLADRYHSAFLKK